MYTLHVVFILPILRDGLFLGETLFTGNGRDYYVPSFATHINMLTHPCPLQLSQCLARLFAAWKQQVQAGDSHSASSRLRSVLWTTAVSRMISLPG
jgi:hypothetical protein